MTIFELDTWFLGADNSKTMTSKRAHEISIRTRKAIRALDGVTGHESLWYCHWALHMILVPLDQGGPLDAEHWAHERVSAVARAGERRLRRICGRHMVHSLEVRRLEVERNLQLLAK
jgi:hypothetical protein